MLAKDVMTRGVISAGPNDRLEEVAKTLIENKISGLPVVDGEGHLLGVVTEKDLIVKAADLKVPFYITLFDSIIYLQNTIRFNEELKKYTATLVKEAMSKKVVVVEEDTPVSKIVEIMQSEKINRVPVVRHGKLVGIVTRNDILKALVKSDG